MTPATRALASALVLAACSEAPTLAPVVDVPAATSPAYPWTDLDAVTLLVTRAGTGAVVAQRSFARGQAPALADLPFADDLVVHLSGTRAGVELAYGRSCPVAVRAGETPPAPHLYFARIVRWAAGPAPADPGRTGGAAYTAPDGSAVLVGGDGGDGSLERFVTTEGRFTPVAATTAPRRGAVVAPLPDGAALRIGGADDAGPVGFFELLVSPSAPGEPVQRVTDPRLALVDHAAVTLVDGSVVVAGGRAPLPGGGLTITGATWSFGLGDADGPQPPRLLAATLATPRARHTLTRLGDEVGAAVLVVGGQDAAGDPVAQAELYEPLRETYASFHPAMVRPRWEHRAVRLPDGSLLIVGGLGPGGVPVDTIELYRPRVGQFVTAATMPAGAGLTELSATALPDGRVLLAGGRDGGGSAVATTLIARLDPVDGTVALTPTDPLAAPRAGHAATLLCDGTVLVVGGTAEPGAPGSERYNPPATGRR